jgi:hypothetical protein
VPSLYSLRTDWPPDVTSVVRGASNWKLSGLSPQSLKQFNVAYKKTLGGPQPKTCFACEVKKAISKPRFVV